MTNDFDNVTISEDAIVGAVCRYFALKPSDLRGRDRRSRVSYPRHIAMFLLRKYTKSSYPAIGALLGSRDHSTVISGCRKIERYLGDPDHDTMAHVTALATELGMNIAVRQGSPENPSFTVLREVPRA